jgi:hypothetical protein
MLHTICAAKFEQMIIHQHVHLQRKSQSHASAHELMYTQSINRSFIHKAKDGRHVRITIRSFTSKSLQTVHTRLLR